MGLMSLEAKYELIFFREVLYTSKSSPDLECFGVQDDTGLTLVGLKVTLSLS